MIRRRRQANLKNQNPKNLEAHKMRVLEIANREHFPNSLKLAEMVSEISEKTGKGPWEMSLLLGVTPVAIKNWAERETRVSFSTARLVWLLHCAAVTKRSNALDAEVFSHWGENMPEVNWLKFEEGVLAMERAALSGVKMLRANLISFCNLPDAYLDEAIACAGIESCLVSEKSEKSVDGSAPTTVEPPTS